MSTPRDPRRDIASDLDMPHLFALACSVLLACGSAGSAPPPQFDPAAFVFADATGVVRTSGSASPFVSALSLFSERPCLRKTVDAAQTVYQVFIDGSSYVVIDGTVARDQVEACLRDAPRIAVKSDGELATFDVNGMGTLYVAWRGNLVIGGAKPVVSTALALHDASQAQIWHDRIASLPTGQYAAWLSDPSIGGFVGLRNTSCTVALTTDGHVPA